MPTTISELAAELDVTEDVVEVYVDQLIDIDGHQATIAANHAVIRWIDDSNANSLGYRDTDTHGWVLETGPDEWAADLTGPTGPGEVDSDQAQRLADTHLGITKAWWRPLQNNYGQAYMLADVYLTDDAAQAVRDAYAAQDEVDVIGPELLDEIEQAAEIAGSQPDKADLPLGERIEAEMLDEIRKSSASEAALEIQRDETTARRDAAIRAAFRYGVQRTKIAAAADISRERVYQIIDGR